MKELFFNSFHCLALYVLPCFVAVESKKNFRKLKKLVMIAFKWSKKYPLDINLLLKNVIAAVAH